jgi:hypothetical protein
MNCQGDPFVIEYNVRMGDPETEAVMLRLGGDLAMACLSLGTQSLDSVPLSAGNMAAVTVVCVSGGYPDTYKKRIPDLRIGKHDRGYCFSYGNNRPVRVGDGRRKSSGAVCPWGRSRRSTPDCLQSDSPRIL